MMEAADRLEFERAAALRNRLQALAHVTGDQAINPGNVEEADVFAAHQEGGQTCVQVFFFRTGQNWGNRAYFPRADRSFAAGEVLESFIAQFYDDKPVPRLILVSEDFESRELMAEALGSKAERRVEIRVPERGTKSEIVEHALTNAREALGRKLAETSSQRRLLEALTERFSLPRVPRRIEVFDNSHIMGTNAVGAMIVAGVDGFVKGQYRKFNIKSDATTPGDDYAMMREVLTRRFKRLAELATADGGTERAADGDAHATAEAPARRDEVAPPASGNNSQGEGVDGADEASQSTEADLDADAALMEDLPERPDLVLIDGGPGQLAVAREVAAELGLADLTLIGVAKGPDRDAGREHFHIPGRERSLMLEPRDPVLYFVQRLRDEAHRFAIGTHRARRAKALSANPLDEIAGIGPTRKRALLGHFGSAKAVSRAGVADLQAVSGISAEMAQKVYDFFHDRGE